MKQRRKYYRRSLDYVPKVYKPVDLAYMAGIVDGEGCFWIGKVKPTKGNGYVSEQFRGLLKVCNTDKRLIDWILFTFDGTESKATRYQPKAKFHRIVYDWVATGDRLLDLCEQLYPYLLLKKEQCEIMIKFRKTYVTRMGNNKISTENLILRNQLLIDIRQFNSRFHNHHLKKHNQNIS